MADPPRTAPLVMAISDRHQFGDDDDVACRRLVVAAQAWASAGVDLIQVRERGLADRDLAELVRQVLAAASGTSCRVIVNERLDVALATAADGVHLPAAGLPAGRVRALAPPPFRVGCSVHAPAEARGAAGTCDYLVLGTVFPSRSKPSGHALVGVEAIAACAALPVPVLAVGGITLDTAGAAFAAGAAGIAAITLFSDPLRGDRPDGTAGIASIVGALKDAFILSRNSHTG